ncbi:MAG: GNAT family N-acetyltransferase [Acholeplasmatales bacterium]|nr:GNAT family N-acetyltransferase [Acholeplasmatales bacterium]
MIKYPCVEFNKKYYDDVANLISLFRVTLRRFKNIESNPDIESAKEELDEYIERKYPIYCYIKDDKSVGYIILRIDGVIWVEQIYVLPGYRRMGIAKALYDVAEDMANSMNEDTVYNYVHPNNDAIIGFLKANDYTVLNLIEVRKKYKGEKTTKKIKIENNEFDY